MGKTEAENVNYLILHATFGAQSDRTIICVFT